MDFTKLISNIKSGDKFYSPNIRRVLCEKVLSGEFLCAELTMNLLYDTIDGCKILIKTSANVTHFYFYKGGKILLFFSLRYNSYLLVRDDIFRKSGIKIISTVISRELNLMSALRIGLMNDRYFDRRYFELDFNRE